MANGKVIYPTGAVSPTTYNFAQNFDFGHQVGYLETYDFQRTINGTLKSYKGPQKKVFTITFTRVAIAQADVFTLLYNLHGAFDLYLDGSTKDASVKIMNAPNPQSEAAFIGDAETYTFEVYMEEV